MPVTVWARVIGTALLASLWTGRLPAMARSSFAAHMTLHLLVVAVAAPLVALGLAQWRGHQSRALRLLDPLRAWLVELVVVWLWHTPALHHAAQVQLLPFVLEQASFLAAGLLFWLAIVGVVQHDHGRQAGTAVIALMLTLAHMTLLGALLSLSPRPLFAHGADPLAALADQQRGGAIMLVVSAIVYRDGRARRRPPPAASGTTATRRHGMKKVLVGAGLLAVVAATVVWSGVISVKASSGHLAPTYWMLDLVKRRSVVMRARGLETPPLDEAALVGLGAAHFERGCRSCHGAPGVALPLVPTRMTPAPPDLARQVGRWQARELFYLVAHGVKFTGMPAWPAPARTDEVWAVVAFLQRLPTLDHSAYQRVLRADDALDPSARPYAATPVTTTVRHWCRRSRARRRPT